jgi:tRNA(adenine34) deaminase
MARPSVSPKGIGSAIRMVQFFLNRAGRNLGPGRRRELERAKRLLQEKHRAQKHRQKEAKSGSRRTA